MCLCLFILQRGINGWATLKGKRTDAFLRNVSFHFYCIFIFMLQQAKCLDDGLKRNKKKMLFFAVFKFHSVFFFNSRPNSNPKFYFHFKGNKMNIVRIQFCVYAYF